MTFYDPLKAYRCFVSEPRCLVAAEEAGSKTINVTFTDLQSVKNLIGRKKIIDEAS